MLTGSTTRQGSAELPRPIVIIGDDLTGCCDSAAPFAEQGARTVVLHWQGDVEQTPGDVHSICTASRHDTADQAAAKIRRLVQRLPSSLLGRMVKKIDSTLKGNIASEVAALMELSHLRVALVAPAFPEQGRLVGDGYLQAPGVADRLHLPSVVRHNSGLPVRHFSRPELAAISQSQQSAQQALPARQEIWTFDAQCSQDLERIVDLAEHLGQIALPVGSAGLAYALARRWQHPSLERITELPAPQAECHDGRFIVLAGSQNPSTTAQLEQLVTARGVVSLGDDFSVGEASTDWPADDEGALPVLLRWNWSARMHETCEALFASLAAQQTGTLVLTGGDTAQWFVDAKNVNYIQVVGDVEPGVSWGTLRGGAFDGWRVITKAGGFGDQNVLVRIYDHCRSKRSTRTRLNLTSC